MTIYGDALLGKFNHTIRWNFSYQENDEENETLFPDKRLSITEFMYDPTEDKFSLKHQVHHSGQKFGGKLISQKDKTVIIDGKRTRAGKPYDFWSVALP